MKFGQFSSFENCPSVMGSRAAVGSSKIIKGASLYSARAMAIFWASPPEISTPCQSPDIQPFHKGDGLIHLFLGDIVGPQAQVQETAKLFLQGEFLGAGYGHIAAHNAGVADIQLIEILIA